MTMDERIAEIAREVKNPCTRPKAVVGIIASRVAGGTGIPADVILGRSQERYVVKARHLVMFEARERGLSFGAIAYAMNRDHTTIIYGVRREARRRGAAA